MNKLLPIFVAATVFLTPLYPVYAQTPSTTPVKRITKPTVASATANLKAQAKELLEQKKEMVSDQIMGRKEKVASRAAELKARLLKFKDKAKATRVEVVNTNLGLVNERRTTHMQNSLTRISEILTKLKSWVAEQKTAGKDVSSVEKIIADTELLWTQTSNAVKDQADNEYSIVVNTEATVKTDAKTARDNLRDDLKAVHDKMVTLRQNLAKTISTARSSLGGQNNGTQ